MDFEQLIGGTPLYHISANLFLKLEYTNLTGSIKDRAALEMVTDAERKGLLGPSSTIIEPTSGNTGISLAAIAAQRGYGCTIIMPDTMSLERRQMIESFGAKIVLTPGKQGMAGSVEKAKELAGSMDHAWIADQFGNPANAAAHYRTTGPEIWRQTRGKVDYLVAGVGTGGTITGTARFLKEKKPDVCVVAVEPEKSPLLSGGQPGSHGIQGIGANFIPRVLDKTLLDRVATVEDEAAYAATRELSLQGLLCGISSGAAYIVAKTIAAENPNRNVVAIMPDSGNRYLSTGIYYERKNANV